MHHAHVALPDKWSLALLSRRLLHHTPHDQPFCYWRLHSRIPPPQGSQYGCTAMSPHADCTATTATTTTTQSAIRNAMSFSHLLTERTAAEAPAAVTAANYSHVAPPSTPERSLSSAKDDSTGKDNTAMPESTEETATPEATEQDDAVADDDSIKREFTCMHDEFSKCRTGQYTLILSRKVISDHFGRNKACTRSVSDWPLFCRKHYQRATYNKDLWQLRKVKLILRQFDIIEREYPGTTYDVTLKRAEEDRLNEFSRKIASGMSASEAADAVAPAPGKTFEAPIDVLRELDQYLGKGKTMRQVKDTMDVIYQMLQEKDTEQVPSIEFLPQLPGKTPTPSPQKSKTPVKARILASPSASPSKTPSKTPSKATPRISTRGGVKKLTQKA